VNGPIDTAIAETGANIENVVIAERDGLQSAIDFVINVRDRHHLATIIKQLRAIEFVSRIIRP